MRYQVRMQAKGIGSMMTIHPLGGEITSPEATEQADIRLKRLLFLDLLESGFYMAERGFVALSLMVTDADCDRLVEAVERFVERRRTYLS
jgi:glutamate-1-semialdehyde 2,1-aminomutase